MAKATFYVQFEGEWWANKLTGMKAVRLTQKNPYRNQQGGTVLVKLAVEIPNEAFGPLSVHVPIEVPVENTVVAAYDEVEADETA